MAASCDFALRALLDRRWPDWHGLPHDCSMSALDRMLGGSTVLDAEDTLGTQRKGCSRSSMNDAPLIAWHRDGYVLLVELDLLSTPDEPPALGHETMHRLDVAWGSGTVEGGEWVLPDRGLAFIVTGSARLVACRGFAPTGMQSYVARLRPRSETSVMPRPARGPAAGSRR